MAAGAALVLAPLVLVWFSSGPMVEVFQSLVLGALLAGAAVAAPALKRRVSEARARRSVDLDPFLKPAGAKAPGPKPASAKAPAGTAGPGIELEEIKPDAGPAPPPAKDAPGRPGPERT